jgi:hypothetical protein
MSHPTTFFASPRFAPAAHNAAGTPASLGGMSHDC